MLRKQLGKQRKTNHLSLLPTAMTSRWRIHFKLHNFLHRVFLSNPFHTKSTARSRKQIKTNHLSPASGVFPNPLSVCSTPCLQSHDSSLLLAVGGRRGQVSSSECATYCTMYVQSIIVFTCSIEMHLSYIYLQNHTIHLYCGESSFIPESCHSAIYLY